MSIPFDSVETRPDWNKIASNNVAASGRSVLLRDEDAEFRMSTFGRRYA